MTNEFMNSIEQAITEQEIETVVEGETENDVLVELHPIREAISRYIHRARDIKWAGRVLSSTAAELMNERLEKAINQIKEGDSLLASQDEVERVHGMKAVQEAMRKLERYDYSVIPEVVLTSLYLSLFTAFDAFTGELLKAIYERKPELFDKLDRKIDLVDVLTATSIDELKKSILENEIENFRRKSYVEQFTELESTFSIKLREFERWPDYVECTQRRNLLTHCGGVVSDQYIKKCKEAGCPDESVAKLGVQLSVDPEYFLSVCELMIEVAFKLGQTLWRKILPTELEEADDYLHNCQYDALYSQNWSRAIVMGEFGAKLPRYSNEIQKRLCIINYCIALKFSGNNNDAALKELGKIDWSASIADFRLAEAVLQDRFEDASELMERIGRSGEFITESAYHTWPLFNAFRETPSFISSYERVYGHPFVAELKRAADAAMTDASNKEHLIEHNPDADIN